VAGTAETEWITFRILLAMSCVSPVKFWADTGYRRLAVT
jgi:hypothetical protein